MSEATSLKTQGEQPVDLVSEATSLKTQGEQAQPQINQPRPKLPTKREDPPVPPSKPKPSYQAKKPKKQPPSNPKPSDPRTTKKRKVLDSKSRPKYDSALKMPVIKSDTFNFNLPHPYLPRHKNLCMRFLNLLNLNQPHPQRNLKGLR